MFPTATDGHAASPSHPLTQETAMPIFTPFTHHRNSKQALVIVLSALTLSGCAAELINVTSGEIGCPREEISVRDRHTGWQSGSWTAECRGRTYYCSGTAGSIECQPATADGIASESGALAQTSGADSAPQDAPGCVYDTQCKGDRVCAQGSCVAPDSVSSVLAPTKPLTRR